MIDRAVYIERIKPFFNKPLIKVLTGIRRCGKSMLLQLIKKELEQMDVHESQIVYLNFESLENIHLTTDLALYNFLKPQLVKTGKNKKLYILLDEIQNVSNWERIVNSIFTDFNIDLYITGSNSNLLSSELSTLIAGRYVEFHIQPLTFTEFLNFRDISEDTFKKKKHELFEKFLKLGGFPVIHIADYPTESVYKIVADIYASVILRDTVQRHNIRNIELLNRLIRFIFDNVGSIFSAKKISDYFKSQQRKFDPATIYNYLEALEGAFIINKAQRYNLRGKEILKTNEKYFVGDISLIYATLGYNDQMIAGLLENIVFNELIFRGYDPYVGQLSNGEIDFVAKKSGETIYVQVAYKLHEQSTVDREFKSLLKMKDNYPKYVVTMDERWKGDIQGVKHMHIADFLMLEKF